jgi:hypothetical protein
MSEQPPAPCVACVAVDCSETSLAELERVFDRQGAVIVPSDELIECLDDETSTAARLALDRQLQGRVPGAGVVSVADVRRSIGTPAGQDAATRLMRHVLVWVRLLLSSMAEGGSGGSLVLVPPAASSSADVVVAHGLIGIARSASVSLAGHGVRTHIVDRSDGDEATFATLVSALASSEQGWLSGHVLATSARDVAVLTDEEPLWQLFADTESGPEWCERVNTLIGSAHGPSSAPR